MKKITVTSLLALSLALGACMTKPAGPSTEQVARLAIATALKPTIASQFPGIPTDKVVDCVVAKATPAEIVAIAEASTEGTAQDTLDAVSPVVERPETLECIALYSLVGG